MAVSKGHEITTQDSDFLFSTAGREVSVRRPRPSRRAMQGLPSLILFALLCLTLGMAGSWWMMSSTAGKGRTLMGALPMLFPSATPSPTSTPTTEEQVAILLAESDQAWRATDLGRAIVALAKAEALQPDRQETLDRLFVTHATLGLKLATEGRLQEAVSHVDIALGLRPAHPLAQEAREMAQGYLDGISYFDQGDWGTAITHLEKLYRADPDYQEVRYLLHQAHYLRGITFQELGLLREAKLEYERAVEVLPGPSLAKAQLHEVVYLLTPPTPTPTFTPTSTPTPTPTFTPTVTPTPTATPIPPKKIVVDISEQRLRAYEGGALKWDFICSTGRAGNNTRRGTFQVLDKIPNAWGGTWGIWMPYWLGIYWAGSTENGFHGLARLSNGTVLSKSVLGRPATNGCIMLSDEDARALYQWAEIGTPVWIR